MKTQSAALLAALLLTAASAPVMADEPFTFKGVTLGAVATVGDLQALGLNFNAAVWVPEPCKRATGIAYSCTGDVTMQGHHVTSMVTIGADGTVQMIALTFLEPFYDLIEAGALAKYGPPTTTGTEPMQTAMGMQVTAIEQDWKREGGCASLINYFGDITRGHFLLETAAHAEARRAVAKSGSTF
jgi:hypothetical protein